MEDLKAKIVIPIEVLLIQINDLLDIEFSNIESTNQIIRER